MKVSSAMPALPPLIVRRAVRVFGILGCAFAAFTVLCGAPRSLAQKGTPILLAQVTHVGAKHPARNPSFTATADQNLYLWWHYPLPLDGADRLRGTPLEYAQREGTSFIPSQQLIYVHFGYPETLRVCPMPGGNDLAICFMLEAFYRMSSDEDAGVFLLHATPDKKPAFTIESHLLTDLPYSIEGFAATHSHTAIDASQDFQYPVDDPDEYLYPDLLVTHSNWYLVGIEGEARDSYYHDMNNLWFTKSLDQGKTWKRRQMLTVGNLPVIVQTSGKDLLVFFSTSAKYIQMSYAALWPDDNRPDPLHPNQNHWPLLGTLTLQRSRDDGQTWSPPQRVFENPLIIQSRAYLAPDGKLWLVYVQSDPDTEIHRTSLWLTSSSDDGKTWDAPRQLTDGKYLDREPDIIARDGKILVAFSRAGRGINTDIWVAEVPVN